MDQFGPLWTTLDNFGPNWTTLDHFYKKLNLLYLTALKSIYAAVKVYGEDKQSITS